MTKAEKILKQLAEWSKKYPRSTIYSVTAESKMGDELALIENQAEKYFYDQASEVGVQPEVSLRATSSTELLKKLDAYCEFGVGQKWCYKFQIPGIPCLITSAFTQKEAADLMVKEIQTHLSESN